MKKSEVGLVIVLVFFLFIILASRIGSVRFLVVLSGSMSPTINMGDLVIVSPVNPKDIKVNDIVAFLNDNKKVPTTHRVVNITEQGFVTKGDANEDPDAEIVRPNEIIGKVLFSLPFVGYFVYFARTIYGFIFLILIPGILLIFIEIRNIFKILKKEKKRKKKSKGTTSVTSLFFALLLILFASLNLGLTSTKAYFSDIETSLGNSFTAWREEVPPITIRKWWTDTCFNSISSFDVVVLKKSNKIVATNPGGFYINIEINNMPETDSFVLTDIISGSIRLRGDFVSWPPQKGNPLHVYLDGNDITKKFDWSFNGTLLNVSLKPGEKLPSGKKLNVTFHLRYALIGTQLLEKEKSLFPHVYSNKAVATINGKTIESLEANLTAYLKLVGCKKSKSNTFQCDDLTLTSEMLEGFGIEENDFDEEQEANNENQILIETITKIDYLEDIEDKISNESKNLYEDLNNTNSSDVLNENNSTETTEANQTENFTNNSIPVIGEDTIDSISENIALNDNGVEINEESSSQEVQKENISIFLSSILLVFSKRKGRKFKC